MGSVTGIAPARPTCQLSMVAYENRRPTRLGVNASTSPASAMTTTVMPIRAVPSPSGSYQRWFKTS